MKKARLSDRRGAAFTWSAPLLRDPNQGLNAPSGSLVRSSRESVTTKFTQVTQIFFPTLPIPDSSRHHKLMALQRPPAPIPFK